MTEEVGALPSLLDIGQGQEELRLFEARWSAGSQCHGQVVCLQIMLAHAGHVRRGDREPDRHPDFDWKNPNRFRSVIGALSANHAGFHHASGAGYRLVADWLIRLDPINPQTAARMSTAFETWRAMMAHAGRWRWMR
jgi:aminopeptidase N